MVLLTATRPSFFPKAIRYNISKLIYGISTKSVTKIAIMQLKKIPAISENRGQQSSKPLKINQLLTAKSGKYLIIQIKLFLC